jgi:tetratricopeptide (TPR) repeat protein
MRILFLFTLCLSLLFSSDYKTGVSLYKNKKYQDSYNLFKKLFIKDFKNKNINFFLGLSAFELGLYDEALSAYERILIQDPNALRIKLEYAKTLFAMKNLEEAKLEFTKIKSAKIPKEVEDNINYFLLLIDEQKKRFFTRGSFNISVIYDNNINSGIENITYFIPKYEVNATGDSPISDFAHQEVFTFNTTYDAYDKGGLYFSNDILIFLKNYKKNYDKNIDLVSTTPKIGYKSSNYDISFSIPLDRLSVEHEISTTSISFQPAINYMFNKKFSMYSYWKYQKKFNQQEDSKDSDSSSIEFSNTFMYDTFSLNLSETRDFKIRGERTDIDKNIKKILLNYNYVINTRNNLGLSYSLSKTIYNNKDANFLSKREDLSRNYGLSFNHSLSSHLNLGISYSKTYNLSNQAPFVNNKDTFTIGITRSF